MSKISKKINKNALCMTEPLYSEFIGSEEKPEGMTMLAYSGKVISGHYYWGDLVIDLNGMEFSKESYPILEDHETSKKIGFSTKPLVKDNALHMEDIVLLETNERYSFVKNSKKGFPYQASIYAKPSCIEEVEQDATVEVNGYTFKGPGTVWRKCTLMESSVCTFGYDPNTESKAFAEKDIEVEYKILGSSKLSGSQNGGSIQAKNKKEICMEFDINKFAELQPEEYTKFVESVSSKAVKEATDKLSEKLSAEHSEIANKLSADLAEVSEKLSAADEKILSFEKEAAIQAQNALVATADALWATKLSESDLPENLHNKVKMHVSYEGFVGDEGLDTEAFSAAIDTEIADWADKGLTVAVLGSGFSQKKVDGDKSAEKLSKEIDEQADAMLSLI